MSFNTYVSGVVRVPLNYEADFHIILSKIFENIRGEDYWWCNNNESKSCLLRFIVKETPEIFNKGMNDFLLQLPIGAGIELKVDTQWSLRNIKGED